MKITIKTLTGFKFGIEVEPSSTIADIKKLIGTTQGAECLPGYPQWLIHLGKILKDETTLEENRVLENDFMVLLLCKSVSSRYTPEGMETKEWGGIDRETEERCRHGKHPRRLLCWDDKNAGRRYLGCPLRGKSNMCDFIKWNDDKCPAMFQEVAANIWKVVGDLKKKADGLQADLSVEIQLKNEMYEENETLMGEKEDWARQKENLIMKKESLERELTRTTLLAQTTCSTLEDRIRSDGYDKKMLYGFILCLIGLMVAILLGVVLENK